MSAAGNKPSVRSQDGSQNLGAEDHGTGTGDAGEKADEVRGSLREKAGRAAWPGRCATVPGVSVRTFRRWEGRCGAVGDDGPPDRRLDGASGNRIPAGEVPELYETMYHDHAARRFHEKLVDEFGFGFGFGCNWLRVKLRDEGRIRKAGRRGAHRRKRPRKPMPGMPPHQDGSTHEWVPGKTRDLIWTMDDATNEAHSGFFVEEEGTMSSFRGLSERIGRKGLFGSLCVDRASRCWRTPEAGGKVARDSPTQVGRALKQLGIEMIPDRSPEARGRSERMFGTLQNRLPQELRTAGVTTMEETSRFLADVFIPAHNGRLGKAPETDGTAFVPYVGDLRETCASWMSAWSPWTTRCATGASPCRFPRTGTDTAT